MKPAHALVLRLLGPLIQILCMIALFTVPVRRYQIVGVPLRDLLYGGFVLGFLMVIAGLMFVRRPSRRDHEHVE